MAIGDSVRSMMDRMRMGRPGEMADMAPPSPPPYGGNDPLVRQPEGDYVPPDPNNAYPFERNNTGMSPDMRRYGDPGPSSFDYVVEYLPVYHWQGQEFIGPIEYAPSWPQDLQPDGYVAVPTTPHRVI